MTARKTVYAAIVITFVVSHSTAQTRRQQARTPSSQANNPPIATQPTISSVESISRLRALSIRILGFGNQEEEIRNTVARRFDEAGLQVLPVGAYPMLVLSGTWVNSSATVGYRSAPVAAALYSLQVDQLLPLGDGVVKATTYEDETVALGLNTHSEGNRQDLVNTFLKVFMTGKQSPALAAATPSGDLDERSRIIPLGGADMTYQLQYQLKPLTGWSEDHSRRWYETAQRVFGDAKYSYLSCGYFTPEQHRDFWYKTAPPEAASILKEFPTRFISNLGVRALNACPPDHDSAAKASRDVGADYVVEY